MYEIMDRYNEQITFEQMLGKTFIDVQHVPEGFVGDFDAIVFTVSEDEKYAQYHEQDCCESCSVSDITGELSDLVGSPVVSAYESSSSGNIDKDGNETETVDTSEEYRYDDSHTWTFYRISTLKGTVVIRWYGSSNGYYSEKRQFCEDSMNPFLAALEGIGILTAFLALLCGFMYICSEVEDGKTWAAITLAVIVVVGLGSAIGLGMNGYLK